MKLRVIQSIAILLWGLQADLIWFAMPMAMLWEAQFFFNRRWAITQQDFYRIADLTSVMLIAILVFLFLNRTEYHFITTLVEWLPILFFPLVIVIDYSTTERMSLDILFYSLRRQKQPVNQSWDMDYMLFGMCLIAIGTNMNDSSFYFPVVCLLICLSLLPLRSSRYQRSLWILIVSITFLAAFGTQKGIRIAHVELKQRAQVWMANWIQRHNNPLKTRTAIGTIGRLKLSNKILFRIKAPNGGPVPGLLQEASYDLPSAHIWTVMDSSFDLIDHADDFRWQLQDAAPDDVDLDIYLEFKREMSLVPLPPGITEINDLPALALTRSYYGAVRALGLVPSPRYQVKYRAGNQENGPPLVIDLFVPPVYRPLFEEIIRQHQLNPLKPVESLNRFFLNFRYSLYQDIAVAKNPLEHFLLERKAGHCEYFATASVLLLRQMGVPARYVVGYAVQEYNSMLDMFVIRQRHAHAWAIAYVNDRWRVVDTTPGIWAETEASQATFFQPALDLLANSNFLFLIWWNDQRLEDYEFHLYVLGALLTLFLIWRISTSEQVIINQNGVDAESESERVLGSESPFFKLEQRLRQIGYSRGSGELLAPWLSRIGFPQLEPLLTIHNQWRFDPEGVTRQQQQQLIEEVETHLTLISEESTTDDAAI